MQKVDQEEEIKVLLATVPGNVHDIGKNLVDIILSNNGYWVINIGIKVPTETIIAQARELRRQHDRALRIAGEIGARDAGKHAAIPRSRTRHRRSCSAAPRSPAFCGRPPVCRFPMLLWSILLMPSPDSRR